MNCYLHQIDSCIIDAKVDPDRLKNMHPSFEHINSSAFGKFLIPEFIQEDKVLYLDSNLIITRLLIAVLMIFSILTLEISYYWLYGIMMSLCFLTLE